MMPVQPPPPWMHGHVDALVEMEEKLQQLRSYHKLPAQRIESFENGLISGFLENFPGEGLKMRVLLDLVRRPSLNSLPSGRGVENILDELQNSPSLPNGPMLVPGPVLPNFGLPTPNSPFIPNWSMAAEAHVPPNYVLPTQYFPPFLPYGPMAPAHAFPNVAQKAHIAQMAPQIPQPNPIQNQKCAAIPSAIACSVSVSVSATQ